MNLKRLKMLALCVALLLTLTAAAQAMLYGGDYQWESFINSGSCKSERAERLNNGQHGYSLMRNVDPTCTEAGYGYYVCIYCQQTMETHPAALGHDWSEWEARVNSAADLCREHRELRYCRRCGTQETRTVAAGHQFGEWKVNEKPTCTEKGLDVRYCARCGQDEWRYTDALGHDWGRGQDFIAATCTQSGVRRETCSRCGATQEETIPLDPEAHRWDEGEVVKQPGYMVEGLKLYTCQNDPAHQRTESIPSQFMTVSDTSGISIFWPNTPTDVDLTKLHIVTEPEGGAIEYDGSEYITLTVKAAGGEEPYTYQWYYAPIKSLLKLTLGLEASTRPVMVQTGIATCVQEAIWQISDTVNNMKRKTDDVMKCNYGTPFELSAQQLPAIAEPTKVTYDLGNLVNMKPVTGATSATLTTNEGGFYYCCLVTDANGDKVTSIDVDVPWKLYVIDEPEDACIYNGKAVELYAVPSGGVPFEDGYYIIKWYQVVSGPADKLIKSTDTLQSVSLPVTEAGEYYCVFQDSQGSEAQSRTAKVEKVDKLEVSLTSALSSPPTTLTATISGGVPPFRVEWSAAFDPFQNEMWYSEPFEGVTDRTIVSNAPRYGEYEIIVTDAAHNYASEHLTLPGKGFTYTSQPENTTLDRDGKATVTASISGGTAPFYVVLYRNGAYYASLDTSDLEWYYAADYVSTDTTERYYKFYVYDPGTYYFQVEDSDFFIKDSATCTVSASTYKDLEIVSQTKDPTFTNFGETVRLEVKVQNGTPPYTYQWKKWSSKYSDVSGSMYFSYGEYVDTGFRQSTANVTVEKDQRWICVVTDAAGDTVTSDPILISYAGAPYITLQPKKVQGDYYNSTTYLTCKAMVAGRDQTQVRYQWEVKTISGWAMCAPAEYGQNTEGWVSRLPITGASYGEYYRCKVYDTRDGRLAISNMVHQIASLFHPAAWKDGNVPV